MRVQHCLDVSSNIYSQGSQGLVLDIKRTCAQRSVQTTPLSTEQKKSDISISTLARLEPLQNNPQPESKHGTTEGNEGTLNAR